MFQSQFLGKGMRRSTFQWKKGFFSEKGGGNSVNQGFGKDFYRKGNSVRRFRPFTEPPDSEKKETEELLSSSPSWKSALTVWVCRNDTNQSNTPKFAASQLKSCCPRCPARKSVPNVAVRRKRSWKASWGEPLGHEGGDFGDIMVGQCRVEVFEMVWKGERQSRLLMAG